MKEVIENTVERKPWIHISNYDGFLELIDSLIVIKHLRKSNFHIPPIGEGEIKSFFDDIVKIHLFSITNDIQMPIEVDGMIEFETILNHYQSDTFLDMGIEYTISKSFFKKYDEQRIRNAGTDKIKDNFRYAILRAFNAAHANIFPFGVRLENLNTDMEAYDRSNLMEFCIINLISKLNSKYSNITKEEYTELKSKIDWDVLKKSELIEVIEQIKEEFGNYYPTQLDTLLGGIKNDSASSTYNIIDCIGNEGVQNIIEKHQMVHILIGPHAIISKELESLNNRNNPWVNINYLFQKIKQRFNISFVNEAKLSLVNDSYTETLNYFKYLIDKAPEYALVPVMALDSFSRKDFKESNDERFENFKNLADLMEGKNLDGLSNYIDGGLSELPQFKYDLINACFTDSALEKWKGCKKKLSQLKKVLKKLKGRALSNQSDELKVLTPSKIDGLCSDKFGYNTYVVLALLFAGDGKTIKNSDDNVEKALELFLDTFFGDDVFVVDELNNTYTIKDSEFLKLLIDTDSDGYGNSHGGRAEYFATSKLDDYKKAYEDFEDYQGTNEERADLHIQLLKRITNLNKFGWWEDTTNGKVVYCGFDSNCRDNVSWEHIQNPTQTYGAIRANETNSSDGAKTKSFKFESDYYQYILEQQSSPKVKKKYKSDRERMMVELQLEGIIEYFKNESR
jgi:hypothetical protein